MKQLFIAFILCLSIGLQSVAQTITVTVSGANIINEISPWIYGRNNNLSDWPTSPTSTANWNLYKEANLRMYRENGGNNSTKYNWRAKLSSHPDWYNNVYNHDWDYSASQLLSKTSNTQGFYGFQVLGYAASNKNNNFNDWAYNNSAWTSQTGNNWAGGGGPTSVGGNGGTGNPNLYLKPWPADSTVGILDHWFQSLNLDSTRLKYWNMDNEPEIWGGTHDDIVTSAMAAETFLTKYFAVAKAARAKFPGIKLTGPVSPNEWQWYTWNNGKVTGTDGKQYPWMEYFIKRIGEEQKASGVRLLDVLDIHVYPGTESNSALTLQLHNLWFDSTWVYSQANGVKLVGPLGWNSTVDKEYFFTRCNNWLRKYIGPNHGVTFGVSEYGAIATGGSEDPNVIANWYASHLGTFANNKVELFTPWDWYKGQWEVLHLYSRYYGTTAVKAASSNETTLSTYASLTKAKDTLVMVVVNRDQNNSQTAQLNIQGFTFSAATVGGLQLANLPTTETFVSHTNNALQKVNYSVVANKINMTVPKLSVTLIRIPGTSPLVLPVVPTQSKPVFTHKEDENLSITPNPFQEELTIKTKGKGTLYVYDLEGKSWIELDLENQTHISTQHLPSGVYVAKWVSESETSTVKLVK